MSKFQFLIGPMFRRLVLIVTSWIQDHRLQYLPVPMYVASGLHEESTMKYRFLVMDRFGEDVEKLFRENEGSFGVKTVCYLGLQMVSCFGMSCVAFIFLFVMFSLKHLSTCTHMSMYMLI